MHQHDGARRACITTFNLTMLGPSMHLPDPVLSGEPSMPTHGVAVLETSMCLRVVEPLTGMLTLCAFSCFQAQLDVLSRRLHVGRAVEG